MQYPQISFQVRINEFTDLIELGNRVEKVLNCRFSHSQSSFFAGEKALETTVLGLWITLSYNPYEENEVRNYVLMGMLRDDLEIYWEINSPKISISEYILGLLRKFDSAGWYIPDMDELYTEAGLS